MLDGDGELGVSIPDDWLAVIAADGVWASPRVEDWVIATNGEGPSNAIGFHFRRVEPPATGTAAETTSGYLDEMPIPQRCGFNSSAITDMPGWYYAEYRWYDCSPSGQLLVSATVDLWPPWVVLQATRYLDSADRVAVERIAETISPS